MMPHSQEGGVFMRKKAIVVAALILAIIVAGFAVFLSACKYQVMSSTEN